MKKNEILIIVPAYNEEGNVCRTVKEILSSNVPVDVLVVDDGSCDNTASEAKAGGAKVIVHLLNLGIGGAVQTGFMYAAKNKYKIAVQIDGDGQHDPEYLKQLIEPVVSGELDIAIGSRFIEPFVGYRSSFVRRIGIHFFAWLISFLTGCKVTDPTSGFRAFNEKVISIFAENYPSDFPEPESIVIAKRAGLKIEEVPVKMRKRVAGHSSIRYLKTLHYMVKVTCAIFLDMGKKKRSTWQK